MFDCDALYIESFYRGKPIRKVDPLDKMITMHVIKYARSRWEHFLSFLIAVFLAVSTLFAQAVGKNGFGSLGHINGDFFIHSILPVVFVFFLSMAATHFFLWLRNRKTAAVAPLSQCEQLIYGKRWRSFLLLLIVWLLLGFSLFPATSGYDFVMQFEEVAGTFHKDYYLGVKPSDVYPIADWITNHSSTLLTNQHGFLLTLIYGGILNISYAQFGTLFLGMLILGCGQFLLMVLSFSETLYRFNSIIEEKKLRFILTALIILSPLVVFTLVSLTKNPLFCAGLVLTLTTLFFILKNDACEKWDLTRVGAGSLMMLLAVKWAIPIVVIILICLIFRKTVRKKYTLWLMILFLAVIMAIPSLAIRGGTISADDQIESKNIQIQQIARLAKIKPQAFDADDKKVLTKIFDMKNIGRLYMPGNSDPVKSSAFKKLTNPNAVGYRWRTVKKEDWDDFNSTWLKLYHKEPIIFNDAFVANNIDYFNIFSQPTSKIGLDLSFKFYELPNIAYPVKYDATAHKNVGKMFMAWNNIPVVNKIINGPFYLIIFLWMLPALLTMKPRYYILIIPIALQIGVLLISPLNGSDRYTLGFVYIFPFLCALLFLNKDNISKVLPQSSASQEHSTKTSLNVLKQGIGKIHG